MSKRSYVDYVGILLFTLLYTAVIQAQNTSPDWSLAGNANASTSSKLGTTNAIPLRLMTKNKARLRIDTIGRITIGPTTPTLRLTVNAITGSSPFTAKLTVLLSYSPAAGRGRTLCRKWCNTT